jgi:2-amino-4-hydroxy-6-hydroxymethyldihydropteridine diphosphokinase
MHMAYIGMGGNLASCAGPPERTFVAALLRLQSLGCITARSSLYSTEAVGFAEQPRFLNAVVALETGLAPHELLQKLMAIEKDFGRDRSTGRVNGPRTLDLDILLFDQLILREPGLEIPHPRLPERAFALVPLVEIAPQMMEPGSGRTVSQLLQDLLLATESKSHAVFKIHNDDWRAGADRGDTCPDPA